MSGAITARWTPAQADFDAFAELSGDDNPIHVDEAFSARTRFGRTVSHGMLLYSRLWALVERHHPGARPDTQTMMFPNPAFAGEELTFTITQDGDGLAMAVTRPDGAVALEGRCTLKADAP